MAYCTENDLLNQMTQPELVQLTGAADSPKVDAALMAVRAPVRASCAKAPSVGSTPRSR